MLFGGKGAIRMKIDATNLRDTIEAIGAEATIENLVKQETKAARDAAYSRGFNKSARLSKIAAPFFWLLLGVSLFVLVGGSVVLGVRHYDYTESVGFRACAHGDAAGCAQACQDAISTYDDGGSNRTHLVIRPESASQVAYYEGLYFKATGTQLPQIKLP